MVGKCPKCEEALSLDDIRVERWYTDEDYPELEGVGVQALHACL